MPECSMEFIENIMGCNPSRLSSKSRASPPPPRSLFPANSFHEELADIEARQWQCCTNDIGSCLEGTKNFVWKLSRCCEKKPEVGDFVFYCEKSDFPCEEREFAKGRIMSVTKEGYIHVMDSMDHERGAVQLLQDSWYYC